MDTQSSLTLKRVLGAIIFGANRPVPVKEIRQCLLGVVDPNVPETGAFANATEQEIIAVLDQMAREIEAAGVGFFLKEVAGGYRLQSDVLCGRWLKHLLDIGPQNRLSRPALETLAIIAYRQPVTRAEIEGVRGVNADHIMRMLLEMQLVRIVGRSELPGKPFMYGTTQAFLEHFGLKDINELHEMEPSLLLDFERRRKKKAAAASAAGQGVEAPPPAEETTGAEGTQASETPQA